MITKIETYLSRLIAATTCHSCLYAQMAMLYAAQFTHMVDKDLASLLAFALYLAMAGRG